MTARFILVVCLVAAWLGAGICGTLAFLKPEPRWFVGAGFCCLVGVVVLGIVLNRMRDDEVDP